MVRVVLEEAQPQAETGQHSGERGENPYCVIELATEEKTLLAFPPISRIVPTTITRITASMTAYSATS